MGERPNVHAEVLLAAAIRFGDARLAHDRLVRSWERLTDLEPLRESSRIALEAEHDLTAAARAYATRMRRRSK